MVEKQAPNVVVERVDWEESGVLSTRREYLRISYGRLSFDICAAPFGKDYLFSWWLVRRLPHWLFALLGIAFQSLLLILYTLVAENGNSNLASLAALAGGVVVLALMANARNGSLIVEDAFLATPFVSYVYQRFVRPDTYYSADARIIFEEVVHRVVLRHVEATRTAANLPPLSPEQEKIQRPRGFFS